MSDPQSSLTQPPSSEELPSRDDQSATDKVFALVSLGAVVASLVAGFWLLGSPGKQRLIALDRERISVLRTIQTDLRSWEADGALESLPEAMTSEERYLDPVSGEPFEYRRIDADTYELCATFATSSEDDMTLRRWDTQDWTHPKGRHCFELKATGDRTIPRPPGFPPIN